MGQARSRSKEELYRLEAVLVSCTNLEEVRLHPAAVYQELLDYLLDEERMKEAAQVVEVALSQYPYASDFYYVKVQLLIQQDNLRLARRTVDRALAIHPGDITLQLLRSEIFIRLGQTSRGLAMLAPLKFQVDQPTLSQLLLVESLAYERLHDLDHMFYALKAALEADPENEQALERIHFCLRLDKRHEESLQIFESILEQNPYAAKAWFYLGQSCAYLGNNERAVQAFEYAFLSDADYEDAYEN
ncbi:MAG: tetratricopeptide repeat protein, partial [Bacteroidota bacterium]